MKAQIQKWGNSLALRIPKPFAAQAGLEQGTLVEVSVVDSKLVIEPIVPRPLELDELLAGITEDNMHGEVDTGPAVGREAW